MYTELYSRSWDFVLYKKDDQFIFTVVFFGLVDYHRSFHLLPEELPDKEAYESLQYLSEKIRNHYEQYKQREIVPAIFR